MFKMGMAGPEKSYATSKMSDMNEMYKDYGKQKPLKLEAGATDFQASDEQAGPDFNTGTKGSGME